MKVTTENNEWTQEQVDRHNKERIERGFSVYDLWSFDDYLTEVICEGLRHFRDHGHGYPATFTVEYGDGTEEEGWKKVLNQIIDGLELSQKVNNEYKLPTKKQAKRIRRARKLFFRYYHAFWD